jgi:S1-C subfamily serine protease
VRRVVPQLIKTGRYVRPALGIEVDAQLNQRLAALTGQPGVYVLRVAPGSAADKAGLEGIRRSPQGLLAGDCITAIDDQAVNDVDSLLARLDDRQVGDVVTLTVVRDGHSRRVKVELQPGT